jgi:hypothetical protein
MNESCEKFLGMLPDYQWLSPWERAPLDRHVAECARCREEWREAQAADELFIGASASAPGDLADTVMSAIDPKPRPTASWLWLALAAVLAVEVAVATTLGINPVAWWRAAMAFGEQIVHEWSAPVSVAWDLVSAFDVTLWGGALVVLVAFSWFTLNHWRMEHA